MKTSIRESNPSPSYHGMIRMDQRGISISAVQKVIDKGRIIHKQSLKFFYVPKSLTRNWSPEDQDSVLDLVVITDLKVQEIITCYRNAEAVHQIKKKPKRLRKKNT